MNRSPGDSSTITHCCATYFGGGFYVVILLKSLNLTIRYLRYPLIVLFDRFQFRLIAALSQLASNPRTRAQPQNLQNVF